MHCRGPDPLVQASASLPPQASPMTSHLTLTATPTSYATPPSPNHPTRQSPDPRPAVAHPLHAPRKAPSQRTSRATLEIDVGGVHVARIGCAHAMIHHGDASRVRESCMGRGLDFSTAVVRVRYDVVVGLDGQGNCPSMPFWLRSRV
jgi:hypothetical protein